jgi:pyruvate formate lyase activating enzyme
MKIGGYIKTSFNEWPGKVTAVVFTKGCNFRCPYCHNAQLVLKKERGKEDMSDESILEDLEMRRKWLDSVVVTGGEPTLQADLGGFLKKIKKLKISVMVETNGSRPDIIAKLLNDQIVDYLAIDIKGPLDETYKKIIKLSNYQIANLRKTLKLIIKSGIDFELRTTVVPGIHDQKTIKKIAQQIKQLTISHQPLIINWFLQNFQPKNCLEPNFNKIKPYSREEMEKLLQNARKIVPNTELR